MNPAFSHFIRAYHPVLDACSHRPQSVRRPRFLMLIHRRFRHLEVIDEKSIVFVTCNFSISPNIINNYISARARGPHA